MPGQGGPNATLMRSPGEAGVSTRSGEVTRQGTPRTASTPRSQEGHGADVTSRPQKAPALLTPWCWGSRPPELGEVNSVLEAALLWGCSSSAGLPGTYLLCWLAGCVSCMREPPLLPGPKPGAGGWGGCREQVQHPHTFMETETHWWEANPKRQCRCKDVLTCREMPGGSLPGSPGGRRAGQPPASGSACLPLGARGLLPPRPAGPLLTATKAARSPGNSWVCWPPSRPLPLPQLRGRAGRAEAGEGGGRSSG